MKILHVIIAEKRATFSKRDGEIICGNSDYKISFTFDAEWDSHNEKTARFIWGGQYYDVPFTGTECDAPIIMTADKVEVGVYAGELQTTTGAVIPCLRSVLSKGATPRPEFGGNYTTEAEAAAEAAKASAAAAKVSEESARASAATAKVSEEAAASAAKQALNMVDKIPDNIADGVGEGSITQKALPSSSGSYNFNFSTSNPHWGDTGVTPIEGDGIFSAKNAEEAIASRVTGLGAAVVNTRSAATGKNAFAAGTKSWARKESDTALNNNNFANGGNSLATGNETIANAPQAASFNHKTYAGGSNSVAMNNTTAAIGDDSMAHGAVTEVTGIRSRAGGYRSKATAPIAFAEGDSCEANGESSAAINHHTITTEKYQTAVGTFNKAEADALFMVGNGDWSTRKNAFVVRKDGRGTVGADGVDDKDIATVGQLNALQSQINALHPAIVEYISMMPYLEENDATNINLLLQKGKKFHFTGNWRTTNLYEDYGELPWEVVEAFGWVNFAWEWTPDTVPSFNGGSNVGNISNFTASLDYTGYTLISASASRMMVSFDFYDDGNGGYSVSVNCELAIEVVIKEDSTGTEYTCTYGYIYWDYHKNEYYEGGGDGCLNYVESYIEKTPETAHFFPNTYDFRTQALDRRLAVALEEAIEKRRAEFIVKRNTEE